MYIAVAWHFDSFLAVVGMQTTEYCAAQMSTIDTDSDVADFVVLVHSSPNLSETNLTDQTPEFLHKVLHLLEACLQTVLDNQLFVVEPWNTQEVFAETYTEYESLKASLFNTSILAIEYHFYGTRTLMGATILGECYLKAKYERQTRI